MGVMQTSELKKGSAEFVVLASLEHEAKHGYQIGKQIESRSKGVLKFHVASLYPLLYRMEKRGWIVGRWVERTGERRRRYYTITASGRTALSKGRATWREFVQAMSRVAGARHA